MHNIFEPIINCWKKTRYTKIRRGLEKILECLNKSEGSIYVCYTVDEIKNIINDIINEMNNAESLNIEKIKYLILPAGSLQDISIDNGWGKEFIAIADNIEKII